MVTQCRIDSDARHRQRIRRKAGSAMQDAEWSRTSPQATRATFLNGYRSLVSIRPSSPAVEAQLESTWCYAPKWLQRPARLASPRSDRVSSRGIFALGVLVSVLMNRLQDLTTLKYPFGHATSVYCSMGSATTTGPIIPCP